MPHKEPWEMTKKEYAQAKAEGLFEYSEAYHFNGIVAALREGKPVPEEVLREYPMLKTKDAESGFTIYRYYQDGRKERVRSVGSEAEAKEHCNDPDTKGEANGVKWFDGYTKDSAGNRIDLKCTYADGDVIHTGFNGTPEEAKKYFVGKTFNLGQGDKDKMVKCIKVEVLDSTSIAGIGTTDADAQKLYYYGSRISDHMTKTPEGYLICHDVPLARIGVQDYLAKELELDTKFGIDSRQMIKVIRTPGEVFAPATLASIEGKTTTDLHPSAWMSPYNDSAYHRGHAQNIRRGVDGFSDYILGDLFIKDATLIKKIEDGNVREVSCGYNCDYAPYGDNQYEQKNIRINHIAIVPNGRAGQRVAIRDSAEITEKGKFNIMYKNFFQKIWAEGFKLFAKDASADDIAKVLSGKNVTDEDGAPSSEILTLLKGMHETLNKLVESDKEVHAKVADADEKKEDKEKKDEPKPEETLDAFEKEVKEKKDDEDKKAKDAKEAGTIEEGKEKEEKEKSEDRKTILDAIHEIKPLIAAMPNTVTKKRMVDAFIITAKTSLDRTKEPQDANYGNLLSRKSVLDSRAESSDDGSFGKQMKEKYHRKPVGSK